MRSKSFNLPVCLDLIRHTCSAMCSLENGLRSAAGASGGSPVEGDDF